MEICLFLFSLRFTLAEMTKCTNEIYICSSIQRSCAFLPFHWISTWDNIALSLKIYRFSSHFPFIHFWSVRRAMMAPSRLDNWTLQRIDNMGIYLEDKVKEIVFNSCGKNSHFSFIQEGQRIGELDRSYFDESLQQFQCKLVFDKVVNLSWQFLQRLGSDGLVGMNWLFPGGPEFGEVLRCSGLW